jgi:hypothetical protein
MVFNLNLLSLSHNGQYIMYENTLYDIATDNTFKIKNTDINFWLNFLKENCQESYKNNITDFLGIQKIIRETVYGISKIFDEKTKELFVLEFEQKYSNNLIVESDSKESNINTISSTWGYIIESVSKLFIIKEQSEDKSFFSKIGDKINTGTDWLMGKGLGWFFENLRKALFSWGGAAVQTFLATSTGGVGNVVLVIVWGAMLAWDLLLGIKGEWDWANIIIDLVGVVTTGPGAKIIGGIFQKLGIMGSKLPLSGIIKKMSTSGSSVVKWFSSMLSKIVSGVSTIGSYMLQGISWLSKKLGIKSLDKVSGQLNTKLKDVVSNISKASTSLKTKAVKAGTSSTVNTLKKGGNVLKSALTSKPGQIATAAGLTYGVNKAFGADNRAFAGSFSDDEGRIMSLALNQQAEYSDEDLP